MRRHLSASLPLLALAACAPPSTTTELEARCIAPTSWAPGTSAFSERTDVGVTGVTGARVSLVDVDHDGDADLVVREVAAIENDTSLPQDDANRSAWILDNDGTGVFTDISARTGFFTPRGGAALGRPGEVFAFGDVNGDGALDAFAGVDTTNALNASLGETSEILLGHDGTFALGAADQDLRRDGARDFPASASFIDVDGDGHLDLWVTQSAYSSSNIGDESFGGLAFVGDRLYRGDGTGRFTDVTDAQGLSSAGWDDLAALNAGLAYTRSWAGGAADLDGDGKPELFSTSYGRAPNHMFRHNDGGFDNVSVASGFAYDDDFTWQDNQFAMCFCEQNPTADQCDTVTGSPLITCDTPNWSADSDREAFRLGGNNATTLTGDLDNDGDLDLVTTTIRHWWAGSGADMAEILLNTSTPGTVQFARPGRDATGLVVEHVTGVAWDEGIMTGDTFDFDNDGRLDVYLGGSDYAGNRGMLFHNDGVGADGLPHFSPVSTGDFFEHNRSHGIAVADLDRDGDLDVVVGHSRARCDAREPNNCYDTANIRVFENTVGNRNNWIQFELAQTTGTNSRGIGASVSIASSTVGTQLRVVDGGHGHFGMQDDLVQHVGLGADCEATITVRWPLATGATDTFVVPAGRRVRLVQGGAIEALDVAP